MPELVSEAKSKEIEVDYGDAPAKTSNYVESGVSAEGRMEDPVKESKVKGSESAMELENTKEAGSGQPMELENPKEPQTLELEDKTQTTHNLSKYYTVAAATGVGGAAGVGLLGASIAGYYLSKRRK